jgi:hypothetical protein
VVTAILVRFEWHGNCPESGTGPPSYTLHSSPPTINPCNKVAGRLDRSVAAKRTAVVPAAPVGRMLVGAELVARA